MTFGGMGKLGVRRARETVWSSHAHFFCKTTYPHPGIVLASFAGSHHRLCPWCLLIMQDSQSSLSKFWGTFGLGVHLKLGVYCLIARLLKSPHLKGAKGIRYFPPQSLHALFSVTWSFVFPIEQCKSSS